MRNHDEPPDSSSKKDDFLAETLWKSRFAYERPRYFPATRERVARVRAHLEDRSFDAVLGRQIDTAGQHVHIDHFHPERVWYEPTSWRNTRRVLKSLAVDREDVFVDYGCGKGRVLYQAALLPFKRVVGIEIAEDLVAIARANLDAVRARLRCGGFEVLIADATEWVVPDDVSVAFFYHPFVGRTFERTIDNLVASLDRRARRMRIVYAVPTMHDYIVGTGRFALARSWKIRVGGLPHHMALYETAETR